jgi:hypothetical protein
MLGIRCTFLILTAALVLTPAAVNAARADVVTEMYTWWNKAIYSPSELTPAAFGRFYTQDTVLKLNGVIVDEGVDDISKRFIAISSAGGKVENIMPALVVFQAGDQVFMQHLIYSARDGKEVCMIAAGRAELVGGKIAVMDIVRTEVTATSGDIHARCLNTHK